jgi:diguanylate cyclase (GGDEF)-like protein
MELDEVIPLFFSICISLLIFIFRRCKELQNCIKDIEKHSNLDHLTGLFNRRYFEQQFNQESIRSKRNRSSLSLILMDIDNFKMINDQYGHNVGDIILTQFSQILSDTTRQIDIVSRWGGEEFVILYPETSSQALLVAAQRLLEEINHYTFSHVGQVTASLGAVVLGDDEGFSSVINRADQCLYQAKNKGKNCFVSNC